MERCLEPARITKSGSRVHFQNMPETTEYLPSHKLTMERVIAATLVALWIGIAAVIGGLPLAIRATLFFFYPLAFVWLPEVLVGLAGKASRGSLQTNVVVSGFVIRVIGWCMILGIPIVWVFFSNTFSARNSHQKNSGNRSGAIEVSHPVRD